ncbi:hypothetical protein [Acinetobacter seifertii]|uniref:hypothetical protein n=1 Tax=Acinetobacter seifertii TaxID=1530123 RepID=UPI0032B386A2
MRNIVLIILSLIVSTQIFAKSKYEPECKVSGFDNRTICSVKEYGVYVYDKPTVLSSVSFGGIWTSTDSDNIGLTFSLGDMSSLIDSISFNLDGEIQNFKVSIDSAKPVHMGGSLWKSTGMVVLPKNYVEKMVNSKNVKFKISTVSKGYREGSFYSEKGQPSEPVETLKALINKIKE